jgi:hypothetical protein
MICRRREASARWSPTRGEWVRGRTRPRSSRRSQHVACQKGAELASVRYGTSQGLEVHLPPERGISVDGLLILSAALPGFGIGPEGGRPSVRGGGREQGGEAQRGWQEFLSPITECNSRRAALSKLESYRARRDSMRCPASPAPVGCLVVVKGLLVDPLGRLYPITLTPASKALAGRLPQATWQREPGTCRYISPPPCRQATDRP